jgi:hypothetical protein
MAIRKLVSRFCFQCDQLPAARQADNCEPRAVMEIKKLKQRLLITPFKALRPNNYVTEKTK